jgi:uncharacterized protein YndB with AHSA1/START domain
MPSIVSEATIARTPDEVFAFVTTPGNWPQWHPSSLGVSGATDHSLEVGESCVEEFVVAGRLGSCEWRVTERDVPRRWAIATETPRGDATIRYDLTPQAGGTFFRRELAYRLPNALFKALDVLFMGKRVRAESDEALWRLKRALETST